MENSSRSLIPPLSPVSFSVEGRAFLITGGTQGLGLAVARLLKEAGAKALVLVSRSMEKGKEAAAELCSEKCSTYHIQADLSNSAEVEAIFPKAEKLLGGTVVEGVVNAAATTARGNLFTTTADDFDFQMALNVRAPFLITQAAAKHITKHSKGGSIVNICSVAAHGGAPFIMAYSCSKLRWLR